MYSYINSNIKENAMIKKIMLITILLLLTASSIPAYELVKDEGSRNEEGIFEDDYLFFGNSLQMSGEFDDLFFLGRSLNFLGKARLGILAFGQDINLSGDIGNGIIAAGELLRVSGEIKGSCFLAGRNIIIEKDTVITGPVFLGAERIIIKGTINGDVYAGAGWIDITGKVNGSLITRCGSLQIDNEIDGDVDAVCGSIVITDRGSVNGNLLYVAKKEPTGNDLKRVKGLVQIKPEAKVFKPYKKSTWPKIFIYISLILTGLLILIIPATKSLDEKSSNDRFWHRFLWGLIPFLIYPSAIILFSVLVVTIPFALILLMAAIPVLYLTMVFGSVLLGKYIAGIFKLQATKRYFFYIIGASLCFIISYIPFLSIILTIIVSSLGWSYLLTCIFQEKFQFVRGR